MNVPPIENRRFQKKIHFFRLSRSGGSTEAVSSNQLIVFYRCVTIARPRRGKSVIVERFPGCWYILNICYSFNEASKQLRTVLCSRILSINVTMISLIGVNFHMCRHELALLVGEFVLILVNECQIIFKSVKSSSRFFRAHAFVNEVKSVCQW